MLLRSYIQIGNPQLHCFALMMSFTSLFFFSIFLFYYRSPWQEMSSLCFSGSYFIWCVFMCVCVLYVIFCKCSCFFHLGWHSECWAELRNDELSVPLSRRRNRAFYEEVASLYFMWTQGSSDSLKHSDFSWNFAVFILGSLDSFMN